LYKYSIGNFPLKEHPCKYWWVRYSVSCTYLQEQFEKIWQQRLKELKQKHGFTSFSSRGIFNATKIRDEKSAKVYLEESKIWIRLTNKMEKELNPQKDKEIWETLCKYLSENEMIGWRHCPYQEDFQSKCPFYEPTEFYLFESLKKLRKRKGYEV